MLCAAAECPSVSNAKITCTPITCAKEGAVVPLSGSCRTAFTTGVITYYVNGAEATNVTCPPAGELLVVEPRVEDLNNKPACDYAGPSYQITSTCLSDAAAGLVCSSPVCEHAGAVVPLEGLCTIALPGASIVYTVGGSAVTQITCPNLGASVVVTPSISNYLGLAPCDYTAAAITVKCESCFAALRPPQHTWSPRFTPPPFLLTNTHRHFPFRIVHPPTQHNAMPQTPLTSPARTSPVRQLGTPLTWR